ncbi:LCP family protein [Yinghuangia seranimata]|uniref:LCP family protein n=1 Tax=Yinghuangia seranimata TaxID=408067 RepID=UPI00248ACB45|nr:LCP family protein [Yinghuangia seranimata]MDI2132251.1 LCP family protein [Yinghuangia seranimata]
MGEVEQEHGESGDGPAVDAGQPETQDAPIPPARRRRRWKRVLVSMAVAMAVLLAGAGVTAYVLYKRLDNQITKEEVAEKIGPERPPVMPEAYGAVNILLMGSDDRTGENIEYGDIGEGTKRSDTTILLHLAADRKSSVAVSIPRDLMVQIPSCVREDGTQSRAYKDQFNHAFEIGGSACTIKTIEQMTQIKVDHHIVVDFTGFKHMVDAVEGVEVCVSKPIKDRSSNLDLPAGRQKLDGEQSLAYVRARKALDDGSDTQRMTRQQRFLASLMNKVKSNGVLFNPVKLYQLVDAGTRSITADPGLASLDDLTKLSRSVSNIPSDKSAFLTVPRQPYRYDGNRDELVQPGADALFTAIRYDRVAVGKAAPGETVDPGGSVRIDDAAAAGQPAGKPTPSTTYDEDGNRITLPPTSKPTGSDKRSPSPTATEHATDGATSTDDPAGTPSSSATETARDQASPSGSATGTPSGTPTGSPGASPSGTASAGPSSPPAGPIVTVTGRTPDQDVCA